MENKKETKKIGLKCGCYVKDDGHTIETVGCSDHARFYKGTFAPRTKDSAYRSDMASAVRRIIQEAR